MRVEIFDVEHGFCALVTGSSGERVLVDCGHNSTTGWRPSKGLGIQPLDLLIITNYDQDHLSDFCGVRDHVGFKYFCANFTIAPSALATLKQQGRPISDEIRGIVSALNELGPVAPLGLPSIRWGAFWIDFPDWVTPETNKHSLVVFMEADGVNIVFPGDISRDGWEELLSKQNFKNYLGRVNVFVASHHGRSDGFCEEVFKYCKPDVVVISDESIQFDTQEDIDYGRYARGITVNGKTRKTLTTRNDGKLTIESSGYGYTVTRSGQTPRGLVLSALLAQHRSWESFPSATGLLGYKPALGGSNALHLSARGTGLINQVGKDSGLSLFAPSPKQQVSVSPLLTSMPRNPLSASLLSELFRNGKKS